MWRLLYVLLLVVLLLGLAPTSISFSASLDWDVPNGHFYTQANGYPLGSNLSAGFYVTDAGGVLFWREFKRLGGVEGVGYPISRRFEWDGFVSQVFQKAVFQWRPEAGRVYFVNVFDQMHQSGKDPWLFAVRSTPNPLDGDFDAGKTWPQIVSARQALLDGYPSLKKQYGSVPDPLNLYGLPSSPVVDNGNHYAVRLQRAVIQQWKEDVPWARKGQVTVANGGDVGKEAGLYPAAVLAPHGPNDTTPAVTPSPVSQQNEEFRGLWVVAGDITSPQKVREVVRRAKEGNFNALLVQVRGRGDAYYQSSLEVRAESLRYSSPDFDPLALLVAEGHAAGLEVHAWMVALLAWSSTTPPASPQHVFNRHRDWFMADQNGGLQGPGAESVPGKYSYEVGAYLSPANPEVRSYLAGIFREVVTSYAVDGVHLDYIRFPSRVGPARAELCYDDSCVSQFRQQFGVDPPLRGTAEWASRQQEWDQWREDQVTRVVREISGAVKGVRSNVKVSAAVSAGSRLDIALGRTHQDWQAWLEEGILDFVVPMLYFDEDNPGSNPTDEFGHYAAVSVDTGNAETRSRVYPGVAAYLNPVADAAGQIGVARRAGARGFAVFSNGAMDEAYLKALRDKAMPLPAGVLSLAARQGAPQLSPPRPAPQIPLGQLSFSIGSSTRTLDRWFYTRRGTAKLAIEQQGLRRVTISFSGSPAALTLSSPELASQGSFELDVSPYIDLGRNKITLDEHVAHIKIVAEGAPGASARFTIKDRY